jgi:hypothetical protein
MLGRSPEPCRSRPPRRNESRGRANQLKRERGRCVSFRRPYLSAVLFKGILCCPRRGQGGIESQKWLYSSPTFDECLPLSGGQRLLSHQSSRPKQDHQNNRPNNTPADPCDVRVSSLPFEYLLMDGHQECPCLSLTSMLEMVASFSQIFSILAFQTSTPLLAVQLYPKRQNFESVNGLPRAIMAIESATVVTIMTMIRTAAVSVWH